LVTTDLILENAQKLLVKDDTKKK